MLKKIKIIPFFIVFSFITFFFWIHHEYSHIKEQQENISSQFIKHFSDIVKTVSFVMENSVQQIEKSDKVDKKTIAKIINTTTYYDEPTLWFDIVWINEKEVIEYSRLKGENLKNIYIGDREFLPISKSLSHKVFLWNKKIKSRYLLQDILVLFKSCYNERMQYLGTIFIIIPTLTIRNYVNKHIQKPNYLEYLFFDSDYNLISSSQNINTEERNNFKSLILPNLSNFNAEKHLKRPFHYNKIKYDFFQKYENEKFSVLSGFNINQYIYDLLIKMIPFLIFLFSIFLIYHYYFIYYVKNIIIKYKDCFIEREKASLNNIFDKNKDIENFCLKKLVHTALSYVFHDCLTNNIKMNMSINENEKYIIKHNKNLIYSIVLILIVTIIEFLSKNDRLKISLSKKYMNSEQFLSLNILVQKGFVANNNFFYQQLIESAKKINLFFSENDLKTILHKNDISIFFKEGKKSEIEFLLKVNEIIKEVPDKKTKHNILFFNNQA